MRANNNKGGEFVKKADNPVIIINGDNNKVTLGESKSHLPAAIAIALGVFAGAAVLAVSHCCPELLADFVRWIISVAINS
ncbi:MAG: hypothetical protein IJS31_00095 [Oscillospiraceae bacterium]|nr:hypothetical protein [Oscillospiraceae bacterium]